MPEAENHSYSRSIIRDIILGGQDGLVNVLGVILAVATATNDIRIVVIAGLAATFAESISMAAVAYTSSKAANDFYQSRVEQEKREIEEVPHLEKREIRDIYYKKGFRGKLLNQIVRKITSNKKLWLDTMMAEELRLFPEDYENPKKSAAVVGTASLIGSLIPLAPFLFMPIQAGIVLSVVMSSVALFAGGAVTAKLTVGDWKKNGLEMAFVGISAAIIGYAIGAALGAVV
ncbi:MAG: VIT1/CCC1 transporter family protein [Candidatus Aenigmarchaeota archaeon]|nr:VIT1/CCC1 transporter family protein [Candidatus Aenigmarchaeota archaeon]